MMRKALRKIRIVLKEDEEGGFYIYSPDLRGCISQGETEEEAVRNFAEALGLWLAVQHNAARYTRSDSSKSRTSTDAI